MAHFSNQIRFDVQRSLAFGAIGAGFAAVGTEISFPAVGYIVTNGTDADLDFSFNGVDTHFTLLNGQAYIQDVSANKTQSDGLFLDKGERLYVKQNGVPTSGSVYFSILYAKKI